MTRTEARKFAKEASDYDIHMTLVNARNTIKDWTKVSKVNKSCTIGTAFNILSHGHTATTYPSNISIVVKINILREFGEYSRFKTEPRKTKKTEIPVHHVEPRELE